MYATLHNRTGLSELTTEVMNKNILHYAKTNYFYLECSAAANIAPAAPIWAGQFVPKILFSVFNSREKLLTVCRCASSLNIKFFPQNLLQQKGLKFVSKICV